MPNDEECPLCPRLVRASAFFRPSAFGIRRSPFPSAAAKRYIYYCTRAPCLKQGSRLQWEGIPPGNWVAPAGS
jgi:hypothetical protein